MMHKRTLHSLLIVSFIAVFAASMSYADNGITVDSKSNLFRCSDNSIDITADLDNDIEAIEVVLNYNELGCLSLEDIVITWSLDANVLKDRNIDETLFPLIRLTAMKTGNPQDPDPDLPLVAGAAIPIANIAFSTGSSACCDGEVEFVGAIWPTQPPFGVIQTQIIVVGGALIPITPVTGGVGISNKAPVMDEIAGPFSLLHSESFMIVLSSEDADEDNDGTCETQTYALVSGPEGMTIENDNELTWQPAGTDVCGDHQVVVSVKDKCNIVDEAVVFSIIVTNTPPTWDAGGTPPAATEIAWGMNYTFNFAASDTDPGPGGPFYVLESFDRADPLDLRPLPAEPTLGVNSGAFSFATDYTAEYTGTFDICVKAHDGAPTCPDSPENSTEVYCFSITVVPFQLTIEKVEEVFVGQETTVSITMLDDRYVNAEMGGFDFLIQYDNSAMAFMRAEEGLFLEQCKWEYFTYRYGANGNCGPGACPSGVLRVVAMAETTGGNVADHPDCLTNVSGISNELVVLHFLVGTDANLECNYAPIRWVWYDCADNGVSNPEGNLLYISQEVFDFAGFEGEGPDRISIFENITGLDNSFPTLTGAPVGVECDMALETRGWKHPWRLIWFYNGGLDIICADEIDAVGDININNIAYEIADAVMFINYFIHGVSAFADCDGLEDEDLALCNRRQMGSIAASDTNKDGITLSVADLVYLIRVIIGDALPYAKTEPMESVDSYFTQGNGTLGLTGDIGAAHVVFEGNVSPTLLATNMDMKVGFDGHNTSVLVYGRSGQSFTGDFLQADASIISTDFASNLGQTVVSKVVPTNFEVSQNYPNPFNPTTKLEFTVPNGGDWKLGIYNINGQLVESFSGISVSGREMVEWDASSLSSGVYFYKVVAGEHSLTKKAILLK